MKSLNLLVVLVILLSIGSKSQPAPGSNRYPFEVKISGQGSKALVLIPGFACSGEVWNETIAAWQEKYTSYAFTMAGFAGVAPQAGATFNDWETAIAAYINEKKLDKPVVIGHSMGGALAMALAADYPELIGKIVVVDALPCLAAVMNPGFKASPQPDCKPMQNSIAAMSNEQFLQMQQMSIGSLCENKTMQPVIVQWTMASDRSTFASMYCDFSNTDLRTKIASIQCPNLVLLEPYFSNIQSSIKEQFENWKNVSISYATKGLHFIMFDDNVWYTEQLKNFL